MFEKHKNMRIEYIILASLDGEKKSVDSCLRAAGKV